MILSDMIWKYGVVIALLFATCLLQCSSEGVWDIRLLNGPHIYEGRVEVYLGNRGWFGTCDRRWGMEEAIVVCRQLRYPGAIMAIPNYANTYNVLLSRDWRCTGDEPSLLECNNYLPTLPCYGYAGVICHSPGYLGCYQDTFGALTSTLIDNMIVEPDMTVDRCRQFCMNRHFRIFGLKNGNECYCGLFESELDTHPKLSDAQCQAPCPGNNRQVCGGYRTDTDKLSVFDVNMGDCVDPGVPDNGFQLDTGFKFGDIVRYACQTGYELVGVWAIQCILAPGGPGEGVIWSTSIPTCSLLQSTSQPLPTQAPTTTPMTTTPSTTVPEKTTTMKLTTTTEPMKTTPPTEKTTIRKTTTMESSKMILTEEPTTTESRKPMDTTTKSMPITNEPSSSPSRMVTDDVTPGRRSSVGMTSEANQKTTVSVEVVNDVTNYTDYITKPTENPGNKTTNKEAQEKSFNFSTMLSEHSILIALGGTFIILLIPIIILVIFKKACQRKKSPAKLQIERTMDYQLGSESTSFTYEPQPQARGRYQSFRRGFKRFSKRPWSDREEDSSDEEL